MYSKTDEIQLNDKNLLDKLSNAVYANQVECTRSSQKSAKSKKTQDISKT
jgi:hypothetical protein